MFEKQMKEIDEMINEMMVLEEEKKLLTEINRQFISVEHRRFD